MAVATVVVAVAVLTSAPFTSSPSTGNGQATAVPHWQVAADLSAPQFTTGSGNPDALTTTQCVSASLCFLTTLYGADAVNGVVQGGSLFVSHDGGHSWAPVALPADTTATTQVSGASASWCALGVGRLDPSTGDPLAKKPSRDPELLVSTDGGASWSVHSVPLPVATMDIPASTRFPAETTYWPGTVAALSCQSAGSCVAVGTVSSSTTAPAPSGLVALATTDGGAQWQSTPLSAPTGQVAGAVGGVSLQCPTPTTCVALATVNSQSLHLWRMIDGGRSWQEELMPTPAGGLPIGQLSCPTAQACWMLVSDLQLLRSTDGGATWSTLSERPAAYSVFSALSCATETTCLVAVSAVGQDSHLIETTDAGESWQEIALPASAGLGNVPQLSCNQAVQCIGIGVVGHNDFPQAAAVVLTNFPEPAA